MADEHSPGTLADVAEAGGWASAYADLRAAGLHWKKAAFVAWDAAPKSTRLPATLLDLAALLNYKSDQVFYKWRRAEWYVELGVDKLRESVFIAHLADVDRRTIQAALTEEGMPGVKSRELFYSQAREARRGEAEQQRDKLEVWLHDLRQADTQGAHREMADDETESGDVSDDRLPAEPDPGEDSS